MIIIFGKNVRYLNKLCFLVLNRQELDRLLIDCYNSYIIKNSNAMTETKFFASSSRESMAGVNRYYPQS